MALSIAFPPVAGATARLLILGSLPGAESLRRQEYYAKPQNAFWWIMGEVFGAGPDLPYAARCAALVAHGVALWDVCAAAERPGSLDKAIIPGSVVPHDFAAFYAAHPRIGRVLFNGQPAAALYRRHVLAGLPPHAAALPMYVLPSTSPAHAARSRAEKLALWRQALTAG